MASKNRFLIRSVLLAAISSVLLTSGCRWIDIVTAVPPKSESPGSTLSQITSQADSVTLAWDPSTGEVAAYKIFYRQHGTESWSVLTEVPAQAEPSLILYHSDFGNGSFDFGVEAVADTGAESPMHSSLDATAQPTSGWYLTWDL